MNTAGVQEILSRMGSDRPPLLQVLLAVQDASPRKYISEEAVNEIARLLKITRCRVYSTASFYSEISLVPRGAYIIRVCANAPCENAGQADILKAIEQELGIALGQTTRDGIFTLESVSCLGACYMSPAIRVNNRIYGDLTPEGAFFVIRSLREEHQNERTA